MVGDQWRDVQREWLHRLGNLTLTGYNSTYSDRPFNEKKSIKGGFEESSVRLNKFVREQPVWTVAEMKQRGKQLARQALAIWPPLNVDKALIDAAKKKEMQSLAERRDISKVSMTDNAKNLFNLLRMKVLELGNDIIELAEKKSVSYHAPSFFMEVLPRKDNITLLLALDFNEVDDPSGIVKDTSELKFIVNAIYEGGVYISIWSDADIEKAFPMIRQAWELARA